MRHSTDEIEARYRHVEDYVPDNIKSQRDRQDWLYTYMAAAQIQHDEEMITQYATIPDLTAPYWPIGSAMTLASQYTGYADIWPPDRSVNMVGVERDPINVTNALTDIPDSAKTPLFDTGLDMLRSELFARFEQEQRRLGLRESSIMEADSDSYYELHVAWEERMNVMLSKLAETLDQMAVVKRASGKYCVQWTDTGMEAIPSIDTPEYNERSLDWNLALHCAKHVGVPERVLQRTRERLEEWYKIADSIPQTEPSNE